MTQRQLDAILEEVRIHRDCLAARAIQLAADLAEAKATIEALQSRLRECAVPELNRDRPI